MHFNKDSLLYKIAVNPYDQLTTVKQGNFNFARVGLYDRFTEMTDI